jgi:hypothetical protein
MAVDGLDSVHSLLDGPSPAVLTTNRKDGTALVSPVWFRWSDGAFEVVIARDDVKLRHLARNPRVRAGRLRSRSTLSGRRSARRRRTDRGRRYADPSRDRVALPRAQRRRSVRGRATDGTRRAPPLGCRQCSGVGPLGDSADVEHPSVETTARRRSSCRRRIPRGEISPSSRRRSEVRARSLCVRRRRRRSCR